MDSLKTFLIQKGKEYAPFDTQRVHKIYAVLKPHLDELYGQNKGFKKKSKKADFYEQNLQGQSVFGNIVEKKMGLCEASNETEQISSSRQQSKTSPDFSQQGKQKQPFIIHILGTNGKGSTGRFITLGLAQNGYKVLHFTSPHLFRFNERFYFANMPCADFESDFKATCNAKSNLESKITDSHKNTHRIATDSELENAHLWLQKFPIVRESSYFEYATFLALYLAKDCDYFVCEAGLGGEFDSTSALSADLSIFTPIGIDHEDFLGNDIASIANTKLKAMRQNVLLAPQRFAQCQKIAQRIAQEKNALLFCVPKLSEIAIDSKNCKGFMDFSIFTESLDSVDCKDFNSLRSFRKKTLEKNINSIMREFYETFKCGHIIKLDSIFWRKFSHYIVKNDYAEFLQENLFCAIFALLFCNVTFNFATLKKLDLRARCEYFAPNILLDVGHNVECAKALKRAVVQKFGKKNIILVYNTYFDKPVLAILSILKSVVSEVLILNVKNERIIKKAELKNILRTLGLKYSDFTPTKLQKDCNYVVFGSFSVVAEFLAMQEAQD